MFKKKTAKQSGKKTGKKKQKEAARDVIQLNENGNVNLQLIGTAYIGDGIDAKKNEVVEVNPEKAKQLLGDFPDMWRATDKPVTVFEPEINSHGKQQPPAKSLR